MSFFSDLPVSEGTENGSSLKEQVVSACYLADCMLISTTPSYLCGLGNERNLGWKDVVENLTENLYPLLAALSPDLHLERGIHPMIQSL